MQGKTIILGVCGGIAAYKAAALTSRLTQAGATVHVILTESAARFVTPLTFQALSRQRVYTDTFAEADPHVISHIDLADRADLFLIAPATANVLGKMANGLADDMLSTTWLACTAPTLVAPAMNGHMLEHPAVQANMNVLRARGVQFIEPGEGQLACGYVGRGRLAEPEQIFAAVSEHFARAQELRGQHWLITAGGTREPLDPVRYIGNRSSGKMGHALAHAAALSGAQVTLVTTAPIAAPQHPNIESVAVESASEMYTAVMRVAEFADVIIKSAAVADYRPIAPALHKIKKTNERLTVEFEKTADILAELGQRNLKGLLVGFAAETERLDEYARAKLARKQCHLLIANNVMRAGAGFGTDTNIVSVYDRTGLLKDYPQMSKTALAAELITLIAHYSRM